ncbi:MarR family winged helix-turn-helix transcriptional regulator [uncultured Cetobacterium sp.]|uniref:MarR family winged helix-turn-helix transcriptional regulator n=1 Tax=uncultured Cetobacterium sp. TaxID=527638 RepID=UPI0026334620|nr:MarR family winged helix-turn-helix transcriptional regulator [uncultured Cetobacterium sp.]
MLISKYLSYISRVRQKDILDRLEKYKIGNTDYPIILFLSRNSGYGQNEVARELKISKSLITKSVVNLERKGYIIKSTSEKNKSKNLLKLTLEGEELVPNIKKIIKDYENKILKDLSKEDVEKLNELLEKIYLNSIEK